MTKSTRPMIRIHDLSTDEIIDRQMTDAEFLEFQARQADEAASKAEAEAKEAERQVILSRLGITEEEARILLGGN